MRLESTCYSNHKLVINEENDKPIAVKIDGVIAFKIYDMVIVTGDIHGYICPGVTHDGIGEIVEIRRDTTGHFYGVEMMDGEFGYMKAERFQNAG